MSRVSRRGRILAAIAVLALGGSGVRLRTATAAPQETPPLRPVRLEGLAVLPALTIIQPPSDAPESCRRAGRHARPGRGEVNGVSLPLGGQPVQGLSGLEPLGDGTLLAVSDNGFGTRENSADVLLMLHRLEPRWETGELRVRETLFLRDPDRRLPFAIVHETTRERYLTGADLDPESLRRVGETLWIGDEFGPYLLRADLTGRLTALFEARLGGRTLRSPDHQAWPSSSPGPGIEVRRSRGFEGLGSSPDGRFLYPVLEGPIEGESGTRILEFDLAAFAFTGRSWTYALAGGDHAIGDFILLEAKAGLLIERDGGEGDEAHFKRLCRVTLKEDGTASRGRCVDLLDIADPDAHARGRGSGGRYRMPFQTIEGLARVDDVRVVVANDNNLPFSSGRVPGRPDDTELALLRVDELLRDR